MNDMFVKANGLNVRVYWSNEDNAYIAKNNMFPSITAHGNTAIEALSSLSYAMGLAEQDIKEENENG